MKNSLKRVCFIALCSLFAGCASLDREACESGQWNDIGFRDGKSGHESTERLEQHTKACTKFGVTPDPERYRSGYSSGIRQYCVPMQGRNLGKAGEEYLGQCPVDLEPAFVREYLIGLEYAARKVKSEMLLSSQRAGSFHGYYGNDKNSHARARRDYYRTQRDLDELVRRSRAIARYRSKWSGNN